MMKIKQYSVRVESCGDCPHLLIDNINYFICDHSLKIVAHGHNVNKFHIDIPDWCELDDY